MSSHDHTEIEGKKAKKPYRATVEECISMARKRVTLEKTRDEKMVPYETDK